MKKLKSCNQTFTLRGKMKYLKTVNVMIFFWHRTNKNMQEYARTEKTGPEKIYRQNLTRIGKNRKKGLKRHSQKSEDINRITKPKKLKQHTRRDMKKQEPRRIDQKRKDDAGTESNTQEQKRTEQTRTEYHRYEEN